jgi:hypothetical protein
VSHPTPKSLRERAQQFKGQTEATPEQAQVAALDELVVVGYEIAALLAELLEGQKKKKGFLRK